MNVDHDITAAGAFLRALDYKATSFLFQTFTDAKPKPKPDPLACVVAGASPSGPLADLYSRGAGIYVTVNEVDGEQRRIENCKRIRAVWCEADGGLPEAWPLDPTLINETSPGHYHCYWLIAGDWLPDEAGKAEFTQVMQCMVESYGSDPAAKDLVRVLRVPGFTNRKRGEPFMVRGCEGGNGHKYTREEIVKAFKPKARREEHTEQTHTEGTPAGAARIAQALEAIPTDEAALKAKFPDQGSHLVFVRIGQALHSWCNGGAKGFELWCQWCSRSPEFNEAGLQAQWRSFKSDRSITIATLFFYAKAFGWREEPLEASGGGVEPADFVAYMPMHSYIFKPTGAMWPASSVNARIPAINKVAASAWLDKNSPVEQLTWFPGMPALIKGSLIADGGWIIRPGCTTFNLYRPPTLIPKAGDVAPWLNHVRLVFGEDGDHIVRWLAQRVQRPQEKINHAIVLGGEQGIGKDTMLEPVKRAIGPWNFDEVSPIQMLGRFNSFAKKVIIRISEARDLGDVDRFAFYDHLKVYTAAPPDVLRIDEKNLREYPVANVVGIIITTNHLADGIYLPADDRRHFVAWSGHRKEDFAVDYWQKLWAWYDNGGAEIVAHYLIDLDLSGFDAKAPPPKTAAFWHIVNASRSPEDAEIADILDDMDQPEVTTLRSMELRAPADLAEWLRDRKNRRATPYRMERCGYVPVRNPDADDGLWRIGGRRQVIYAKRNVPLQQQLKAARRLTMGG